jgi:hypothetical protein
MHGQIDGGRNELRPLFSIGKEQGMAEIIGVHHTSFTVARLEQSLEFFRDLLGLEVVFVRDVDAEYFGRIVGLPGCKVKAALLRVPTQLTMSSFSSMSCRRGRRTGLDPATLAALTCPFWWMTWRAFTTRCKPRESPASANRS